MADDWLVETPENFQSASQPLTPELSLSSTSPSSTYSSYAPSSSLFASRSDRFLGSSPPGYTVTTVDSADITPRGSWLPNFDYHIVLSLDAPFCQTDTENDEVLSRPGSVTPRCLPRFDELSFADIEALEELPGSSGRRQSSSFRFGLSQVIKISPHRSILYEARVLAYIRRVFPTIPVPQVLDVRQLCDTTGRVRYCMLMEYIDGIGADEAACEWSYEETRAFMHSVESLRQTLAGSTSNCIQAVDGGDESTDGDYEMSDDEPGADTAVGEKASGTQLTTDDSKRDAFVQDELFDHIRQTMDRGPFTSEAVFVEAVGIAFQRRGTGAPRLDLVSRMVDQISKPCQVDEPFYLQHANLTLGNFLVRRTQQPGGGGTPEIVGVLGWGQAGFYPAWWELAKMAASEDRLLVDLAVQDEAFLRYSQHASVMLHVRDIIY
ncbi:hypothetical protein SBRCBS47491_004213 [Sporothrix bragantina]|uniref:Aminoglycoside phosphotransferase domain-containing protein n=1 Tax=Sporothrix bragantina TaxID=671064 RepID=A0ABP0BLK5_9PEZI